MTTFLFFIFWIVLLCILGYAYEYFRWKPKHILSIWDIYYKSWRLYMVIDMKPAIWDDEWIICICNSIWNTTWDKFSVLKSVGLFVSHSNMNSADYDPELSQMIKKAMSPMSDKKEELKKIVSVIESLEKMSKRYW